MEQCPALGKGYQVYEYGKSCSFFVTAILLDRTIVIGYYYMIHNVWVYLNHRNVLGKVLSFSLWGKVLLFKL